MLVFSLALILAIIPGCNGNGGNGGSDGNNGSGNGSSGNFSPSSRVLKTSLSRVVGYDVENLLSCYPGLQQKRQERRSFLCTFYGAFMCLYLVGRKRGV